MKIQVQSFRGIAPRINPRYLGDGLAQEALDVRVEGDSLDPLKSPGTSVHSLPHGGFIGTLYKYGEDITNPGQHWFAWSADVDVCRGQIADDPSEWTFYTGDGVPKATYNDIALGAFPPSGSIRLGLPAPTHKLTVVVDTPEPEEEEDAAATVTIPSATVDQFGSGSAYTIQVAGGAQHSASFTTSVSATDLANSINSKPIPATATVESGAVVIRTDDTGADAFVRFRSTSPSFSGEARGSAAEEVVPPTPDYRVYVYTVINEVSGLTMESAPSPPTNAAEVYDDSTVTVSGFAITGGEYTITGFRLYRSVDGAYLFVDEIAVTNAAQDYVDSKLAEDLGETLPSLEWDMPPSDMRGLINLPNGMMAGFSGRDLCFCEPYKPYAWPTSYRQTLDYPIVALGRMDTTLAVLTAGNPYFVQGSHPDTMTVVKADIEQACASKRSVVSINGAVYYVSPDGLMKLSSGGSELVTQAMFTAKAWRDLINVETKGVPAFSHDQRYIAFCHFSTPLSTGTTLGGFVFDTRSGEFYLHSEYAQAGFTDLRNDTLYITRDNTKTVRPWEGGGAMTGYWRSKVFSMPRETFFNTIQVEAEAYTSLRMQVFCDGVSVFGGWITLSSRAPQRMPVFVGRDWEVWLETNSEIFNVIMAQSMEEVANG